MRVCATSLRDDSRPGTRISVALIEAQGVTEKPDAR